MTLDQANVARQTSHKNQLQSELRLNYQTLAQEVIKALRGPLSQRDLSEKLGFTFNQVGKWESGATQIKWDDFLSLAKILNIPIEKHFRYSFFITETEFDALSSVKSLVKKLNLLNTTDTHFHSTIKRWINGETMPIFSDILRMIGSKSPLLFGWLSLFVDCHNLNSLKEPYHYFLNNVDIVLKDPIVVYVNAALQIHAYKELSIHDDKLLAEHSACSLEQLKAALKTLVDFGLVTFDGQKYHHCSFDFSFSGLRHPKLRNLTKYTTRLAAERYPESPIVIDPIKTKNVSRSSVRVSALSFTAAQKVSDLIVQFHNQVDAIVKNDNLPKDNVQIFLIHSFASNINKP